ncbi:type II toxin-antitoxin system PemK/MazF family toxin [Sphingomonas bacterium]|uniref:type II toxin-antitoxin system PemK/MazF family toxin n=1 Tax=Sphingomonas bacterium TaxID=1895847 RepID=UPI001575F003
MVIAQGDIWWADASDPAGSELGYTRPVLVVQSDRFNASTLATVLCVPLESESSGLNRFGIPLVEEV